MGTILGTVVGAAGGAALGAGAGALAKCAPGVAEGAVMDGMAVGGCVGILPGRGIGGSMDMNRPEVQTRAAEQVAIDHGFILQDGQLYQIV